MTVSDRFRRFSSFVAWKLGSHWAFIGALAIVVAWAATGPLFHYSVAWQLVINTGTTIVTFLMVFVIQASQNRDARATQLKLDELIRAVEGARNELIEVEEAPEETVALHKEEFRRLVDVAEEHHPEVLEEVHPEPDVLDEDDPEPIAKRQAG